jgi:toxin ParE1/3/4
VTTSSRKVDLSPDARRDLREILRFSRRQWGDAQRDRYAQQFNDTLERLAQFSELGERRDDLSVGIRSLPIGHHILFYEVDDRAIKVHRLVHVKMDVTGLFDVS